MTQLCCRFGHEIKVLYIQYFFKGNHHKFNFISIWPEKPVFLRGSLCSSSINLALALGEAFTFYSSVAKGSKLKFRTFWGLILTFGEVAGQNLVGGLLALSIQELISTLALYSIFFQFLMKGYITLCHKEYHHNLERSCKGFILGDQCKSR